jgi:hypothetical protein
MDNLLHLFFMKYNIPERQSHCISPAERNAIIANAGFVDSVGHSDCYTFSPAYAGTYRGSNVLRIVAFIGSVSS